MEVSSIRHGCLCTRSESRKEQETGAVKPIEKLAFVVYGLEYPANTLKLVLLGGCEAGVVLDMETYHDLPLDIHLMLDPLPRHILVENHGVRRSGLEQATFDVFQVFLTMTSACWKYNRSYASCMPSLTASPC
ncbi:hypothetical protein MRB53_038863 [Persea americana]|nr:hypothetical protein MRB53_038863 [Persea americana]